jgi:hypothetical protein
MLFKQIQKFGAAVLAGETQLEGVGVDWKAALDVQIRDDVRGVDWQVGQRALGVPNVEPQRSIAVRS